MIQLFAIKSIRFSKQIILLIIFFISISSTYLYSQDTIQQDTVKIDNAKTAGQGLFNKENKNTFKVLFSGKPGRAALYSLIIPGGGQAYNKRYWYIPIVWAGLGWFGYQAIQSSKEYNKAYDTYKCLIKNGDGSCVYQSTSNVQYSQATLLRPEVDKLHSARERNWVIFGIIYLVQVFHAYVQRHLIDFDLNEDLSITPSFQNGTPSFGLSVNLNSKKKK